MVDNEYFATKVVGGLAMGQAAVTTQPVSIGAIDCETGALREPGHELNGHCLAGRVLVCPTGKGSSGGSYVLLNLVKRGLAPAAIIAAKAEAVMISGAVLARVPLVHKPKFDLSLSIRTGDVVTVDADNSRVFVTRPQSDVSS